MKFTKRIENVFRSEYSPYYSTWRFNFFRYLVIFFCSIIIVRLFQIQVINAARYKSQAREQQWQGYKLEAKRGNIYTSDGYPVALSQTRYDLTLNVKTANPSVDLHKELSKYLKDLDQKIISDALESKRALVKIASDVTLEQKKLIEEAKINGLEKSVSFEETYSRYYPEETLLSHVLGFVGKDKLADDIGYYGVEQYYDGDLRGQPGWLVQEKSAGGDPILWAGRDRVEPVHGSDLYLTIDRYVQFLVEMKIEEGVKKHNAKSGSVVVMNPSTGEILAMANYPDFSPSEYQTSFEKKSVVFNGAISNAYEPGSVIKGLTMSAAIDLGKVTPLAIYFDDGPKWFSGHKVDNWDGKHYGNQTMIEVLQRSNNLGAAWVGGQIGGKPLMEYFQAFSFGSYTNIDLGGEEKGILYSNFPLKEIELINASFGQGIAATPLQIAVAFSAIANDGVSMRPYVVKKVISKNGVIEISPSISNRPISISASRTMVDMLTQAVDGGEAKFFVLKRYKIAGKTGTAQIAIKGGYDTNRTNATFVGFFPSYRNFVMLVKLEEPTSPSGYSAETAVPLWMEIAEKLTVHYGLLPDKL